MHAHVEFVRSLFCWGMKISGIWIYAKIGLHKWFRNSSLWQLGCSPFIKMIDYIRVRCGYSAYSHIWIELLHWEIAVNSHTRVVNNGLIKFGSNENSNWVCNNYQFKKLMSHIYGLPLFFSLSLSLDRQNKLSLIILI